MLKKGDLRKKEIIQTAEILFCSKGYEQTSIQDILDILKISKGSFYHHFVSKESLLEAVCSNRIRVIYQNALSSIHEKDSSFTCLNILLSGMIPFKTEKLPFLLMLMPVFRLPEGRTVKLYYCDMLQSLFLPEVIRQLKKGHITKELFCPEPDITADLITALVNRLWIQICERIIETEENGEETDFSDYLRIIHCYRLAIEQLISLPYGSMELISLTMLRLLSEQIHNHWSRIKNQ